MVISWLDRDPWAAVSFAVPLTIVLLVATVAHPILFVPLLVLVGVALVVMDFYLGHKREAEQQAQVAAGPQKRNRQHLRLVVEVKPSMPANPRGDQTMAPAERKLSRLELEAEARARAEAAEAEARARAIRLRA
jgi:hypothetical protein